MHGRVALLACLTLAGPAFGTKSVSVTPVVAAPYVAVGMYFGVDITVRNTGTETVIIQQPWVNNLNVNLTQVTAGNWGDSNGGKELVPGAEATIRQVYIARVTGTFGITFTVNLEGGSVQVGSGAVSFTVKNASEVVGAAAPAKGSMQVRGNIVRLSRDGRSTDRMAYIVLHGQPGGNVVLTVWGAGRTALGRIEAGVSSGMLMQGDGVHLDGNGWAGIGWDGKVSGKPLDAGSYWIVATGAILDRKPVLVCRSR